MTITQDEAETTVVFRVWREQDGGDVIALFPEVEHNGRYCESYMHVGQHGGADYALVIQATRPARPEEYAMLQSELEIIGYRLQIRQKRSWSHDVSTRSR